MSDEEIKSLKAKRAIIKGQLTRFENFVANFDETKNSKSELLQRVDNVAEIMKGFIDVQARLEMIPESGDQTDEHEQFENKYFACTAKAKDILNSIINTNVSVPLPSNSFAQVKLPPLNLPEFDGNFIGWKHFHDAFVSAVHSNSYYSNVQKFSYLISSLKGEAKEIVTSIPISDKNYTVAWDLICKQFDNLRVIVHGHISAIDELAPLKEESKDGLKKLLVGFQRHIRALDNLGDAAVSRDTFIIYQISKKLDPLTKREWERSIGKKELPTLEQFTDFLSEKCEFLETLTYNDNSSLKEKASKLHKGQRIYANVSTDKQECGYCKKSHSIYTCHLFLKLTPKARYEHAKRVELCTNCLKSNHSNKDCASGTCRKCQRFHHTLLHIDKHSNQQSGNNHLAHQSVTEPCTQGNNQTQSESNTQNKNNCQSIVNAHCIQPQPHILLATVMVNILNDENKSIQCRALLDSGSQSNFMTTDLAKRLRLATSKLDIPVVGINNTTLNIHNKTQCTVTSVHGKFKLKLSCLLITNITGNIPQFSFDVKDINIPPGITLADPNYNQSAPVELLLGAGIFLELLCPGQIKIGNNQPLLQNTKFGWILSGPLTLDPQYSQNTQCHLAVSEQTIHNQLERFWKIEECNTNNNLSQEELECEQSFVTHTKRDSTGRFIVQLPLRENYKQIGQSEDNAVKRFLTVERKLSCNPELKQYYVDFMSEYESLGHMTKIDTSINVNNQLCYYMPHHSVIKASSTTTKVRVVFDASSKTSSGISLNDVLKIGPNIQDDLFSIVSRFRTYNIVVTSDIAKMYRQVLVAEEHRDLQRIVWRSNPDQQLEHYRLNTVTYGTASASFLAVRCLHEIAYKYKELYPQASNAILKDFYVDDFISGADTSDEAIQLVHDVSNVLSQSGFELRKWMSNNQSVLESLSISNNIDTPQHFILDDKNIKALGLLWDAESDSLTYLVNIEKSNLPITKRSILSAISQIFDPLGLIGACTIYAKIVLQQLWQLKIGWDDPIPGEMESSWRQFYLQLLNLNKLKIPRRVTLTDHSNVQVHGFCDSSQKAYGSCIYLRTTNSSGEHCVQLLCAKSRVAPLKTLTLPRLELCGAVLLSRLMKKTLDALNLNVDSVHFWCDSTIVLFWLRAEPNLWKTFVAHRVAEIQQLSDTNNWKYVPTNENPADIISRGMLPDALMNSSLWWHGPSWLSLDEEHWPKNKILSINEPPEKRKLVQIALPVKSDFDIFVRYSSLTKLQRVIAYCIRFFKNSSNRQTSKLTGNLTSAELSNSLLTLSKLAQLDDFKNEILALKKSKGIPRNSKLKSLNPFLDKDGILRVGGRICKSQLPHYQKHQILLSDKHQFAKLIINNEHLRLLHAGPQAVLSSIRTRFWILNGRNVVRNIIHRCITCFKVKPVNASHLMGNLPEDRVTPSRPFLNCGIDLAGPINIKDGKTRNRVILKAYLCVFVCFATKCVHLEIVSDLTTESFLNALKRFISRRGICLNIYTDNGTNFVGSSNELNRIYKLLAKYKNDGPIAEYLSKQSITWHFIPPRSPHFGGLWEAAVKSAKFHMKRILGNANLTFEQLYTVVVQIEAILNSRPLTPLSSDPHDLMPLTPSHFLIGEPLTAIPQEPVADISSNRLSQFKRLQQMVQHFWHRWKTEYLHTLQQRVKWQHGSNNPVIGSMVLLKNDGPPLHWQLGRIVDVFPGEDQVVRVVNVRTSKGVVKRAVSKIAVLPIDL